MLAGTKDADPQALRNAGFRLGYNACGFVEESCPTVPGIGAGDLVACYGGPYVEHASVLAVPHRLAHPVPAGLDGAEACFMGLGAIALHGMRCGQVALGESVLVIGAGVIGQLVAQLACLAGCRVLVTDPLQERLDLFAAHTCRDWPVSVAGAEEVAAKLPAAGADVVLVAAASSSSEPVARAFEWVARRGRIVLLGAVPIEASRSLAFEKEATLVATLAAGPGRYDPVFERDGIDYPQAHVRWTEQRNCREVLALIAEGRLRVRHLISRTVPVAEAPAAYSEIARGSIAGTVLLRWGDT